MEEKENRKRRGMQGMNLNKEKEAKKDTKETTESEETVKKTAKVAMKTTKKMINTIIAIKNFILTIMSPAFWKAMLMIAFIATLTITFTSIIDYLFDFKEYEVNDKARVITTILEAEEVSPTVVTNVTSRSYNSNRSNSTSANQIKIQQNDDNTGYEFSYDNTPQNLEGIKEQLDISTEKLEEFSDFEIAVLGAFISNGANLNYYTDEELKCFATFFKVEAATQNLDLRPNSEKEAGKTAGDYIENYEPKKIKNLDDNEVPGVILVQRTNTDGSTPITLEYKEKGKFEELLAQENPNGDILNYFTINENGNIVIAKWEKVKTTILEGEYPENLDESEKKEATSEEGIYILDTEEIQYIEYISKYKMPFEFLVQLLVTTQQPSFCMKLADYALNSKIVIDIQEQQTVTVTDETRNYLVYSKDKKYLNYEISAAEQQIVTEENIGKENNYLNYAQDDEGNYCTNYYTPPENITVKIRTEYTSNSYSFEIIEADTWIAHYTKKYDYSNATGITEPSTTTKISSKGQYKKIEKQSPEPITDKTSISADKDVTKFINETKRNYEPKIVVPQSITISDVVTDENGNKFKLLNVVYKDGTTKQYKKCSEIKDENGNGTGEYNLPTEIIITTDKVASTATTKEIPQINYTFKLKKSTNLFGQDVYSYKLETSINPLVECNVSALSIEEYQKIELLDSSTITTTVTKYPTDETPVVRTYIYAVNNETGEFEKFLAAYDKSPGAQSNLRGIDSWLYEMMEKREETVELIDVVKYLLYKYDGQDRGVTDLEGLENAFIPNEMKNASFANSFDQFIRYLHSWEGGGTIYKDSNGVDCYKVQSDGSVSGSAVGYGVDIGTHGAKLRLLGYDTSIGSLIPVEIVDEIEKNEILSAIDRVKSKTAGLNLTEYQIYALVSRAYNCGVSGALDIKRGSSNMNFVNSYKQYWSEDTDNKFGEDASSTDFNNQLYTQYMSKPTTSNGEYLAGLENRRKSEWCLFQTGYFGYDLKHGSGHGIDEYCSSSATDMTNNINLYNQDGSVNADAIQQLEDWLTNDLLNTKIHNKSYEMQGGPFEKWWDYDNNEFTSAGYKFQCTWYAYGRANQFLELYGTTYKEWPGTRANAGRWYNSTDNGGQKYFECGSQPRPNSIAVWKNGNQAGHVAYVEAVDTVNNRVYISHAGSGSSWFGITDHSTDEMKLLWGSYQLLGYVYLDSPK